MTSEQIYAELADVFAELFDEGVPNLAPATTAADVPGWDSFTHLSLIVAVETHFGIRLSTKQVEGLANIGDLVAAIQAAKAG